MPRQLPICTWSPTARCARSVVRTAALGATVPATEAVADAAAPTLRVTKVTIDGQPATAAAFAGLTEWLTFGTPVRFEIVRSGSSTTKNVVAGVEP
jgi:hypothetical protein